MITIEALKYLVRIEYSVKGNVDKNDVVGALFGQTEGLFAPRLDLRELQKTGRVGRIDVTASSKGSETVGSISIPSGLSRSLTAIIAASIESIEKVGPYAAKFTLKEIEDTRKEKRVKIIKRAKEIMHQWTMSEIPRHEKVEGQVEKAGVYHPSVTEFGSEKLSAGPAVASSDSVIVVEGRADVVKLLSCGINNVVALNGVSVPKTIIDLSNKKEVTAFVDGDRGGEFILRELLSTADVRYVIRAPEDTEVEELSATAIKKLLKRRVPADQVRRRLRISFSKGEKIIEKCKELLPKIKGTLEAQVLDKSLKPIASYPVSELADKVADARGAYLVIFDGVVTQRLVNIAENLGVRYLCGARVRMTRRPSKVRIIKFEELEKV